MWGEEREEVSIERCIKELTKKKKEVCPPASLEFPCQCNKIALYLMDSKQRGRGKKRYIEIGLDIEK